MKPTFLNQLRPFVTGMVLKETADEVRYGVKNAIYEGADALGIQLEKLKPEYKTEEYYRKMFAAAGQRPIYITNYRGSGLSDEEGMEQLITALGCGATLGDVMGNTFDPEADMEMTYDPKAIDQQKKLIDRIHAMGKEVIMSSHVHRYIPAETVLEIAHQQRSRGADIVKIVTAANSDAEQMENLRITTLLKQELDCPFLFLAGGTHSKIQRMIGPMLGCFTYLAVAEHCATAVSTQPTIRAAKAVRDNFDYMPDLIVE